MTQFRTVTERESLRKHVAAIHVGGKLTLLQRKLSNCLLLHAYDELLTKNTHRIDAETLCALSGYTSRDRDTLKAALRALAETTAEWNMLGDNGEEEWGVSSLISYAKLAGGVCEYAYSAPLAAKLFDPSVFSMINMRIQRNFTSGHALALYENCFRFVRTGSTGWWELDVFRRLMGVHDMVYYDDYSKLNAKIIKPSVKEVNAVSDISLVAEVRRESRRAKYIRFLISRNGQETLFDFGDDDAVRKSDAFRRLVQNGIAERLAQRWIAEHGEAYVAEKMDFVEAERRRGRVRKTPTGYLAAAIKGDFKQTAPAPVKSTPVKSTPVKSAPVVAEPSEEEIAEIERTAEKARFAAWRQTCLELIDASLEKRSPASRKAVRVRFERQLEDDFELGQFRRYGWHARAVFSKVRDFWSDLIPEGLPEQSD
ncbi:replication initiation protein [Marinovum sp. 2_MG-2023]|uniref:replication initiation protein n=1 Tax=Marinovum sp. 2_MG-2023 TaxID=3062637 RepID=UPI0026E41F2D|nr:replication initiation protein [Marinovum sp. 2_MG-2023]MDO6732678.1 replication initiation protein [Marinovum sp. 2_MG-2023]